jgi:tRNA threonylcarbamoyladenosine biosynthesis protein TsaE
MKKEKLFRLTEIPELVEGTIRPLMDRHSIFTFEGPLGAGKTTFIKEIMRACGVGDLVASPTFTYVNSYTNGKNKFFHHFDLYRITSIEEFLEMGFDEYFYKKNEWCFIEWPQVIRDLLHQEGVREKVFTINLQYVFDDQNVRRFIGL